MAFWILLKVLVSLFFY